MSFSIWSELVTADCDILVGQIMRRRLTTTTNFPVCLFCICKQTASQFSAIASAWNFLGSACQLRVGLKYISKACNRGKMPSSFPVSRMNEECWNLFEWTVDFNKCSSFLNNLIRPAQRTTEILVYFVHNLKKNTSYFSNSEWVNLELLWKNANV